jgi:SAM-dependent methyltransferase
VADFGAEFWDERYRAAEMVWGAAPNRWVEREVTDLAPGAALDLGCGEGRNAVWLAGQGWRVQAVDFSAAGVTKGADLEKRTPGATPVTWIVADATTYVATEPVELALLCYLQLDAVARRAAVRAAAAALAPGGTLLVIGHDSRNLTDGTGGPPRPEVLFTAADIASDISDLAFSVIKAEEALRPVDGADRPAIDALFRGVKAP